jgi:hypothetical protein
MVGLQLGLLFLLGHSNLAMKRWFAALMLKVTWGSDQRSSPHISSHRLPMLQRRIW